MKIKLLFILSSIPIACHAFILAPISRAMTPAGQKSLGAEGAAP
jgi:hypothetical protein